MKIKVLELPGVTGLRLLAALTSGGVMAVANSRLFLVARAALCPALVLLAMAPAVHAQQPSAAGAVFPGIRDNGPDVSNYISPSLEPGEHEYMRSVIDQLPASMKEKFLRTDPTHVSISVFDGATGETHFNRPELAGSLRLELSHALPGDDYPFASAKEKDESSGAAPERVTSCGASPIPGCTSGAGPYRRIFTPKVAAEVDCPSGVTRPCGPGTGTNDGYWVSAR